MFDVVGTHGKTQGSMLQKHTKKTLTTNLFGNTCEEYEFSPEVEEGRLQDSNFYN